MTELTPLGAIDPTGLQYLIDEGLLAKEAPKHAYTWRCYTTTEGEIGEEVLFTKTCAIYSKGGYVRKILRFNDEDGAIRFAVLTDFAPSSELTRHAVSIDDAVVGPAANGRSGLHADSRPFGRSRRLTRKSEIAPDPHVNVGNNDITSEMPNRRALAVFVGTTCHIYFIEGSTYVLDVPCDLEAVFPCGTGLVVQSRTRLAPADRIPEAPPNSFRSSQPQTSQESRTTMAREETLDRPSSWRKGTTNAGVKPIFESEQGNAPRFLALSDPLVGFSIVAAATIAPLPRHLRLHDSDLLVEYDDLDEGETLLYVSMRDEMDAEPSAGAALPLFIVVSLNDDLGQITVWQGWHLSKRRLSTLTDIRKEVRTSRARRRSSLNPGGVMLGNATPAVRFHDKGRESFAARAQNQGGRSTRRRTHSKTKRAPEEDEATAMASRLDPEFQMTQPSTAGPRRAGSMLARGDFGMADRFKKHTNAQISHTRSINRGQSFRASQDRRSFGTSVYRKSRGSVPGSTFSQSVGPEGEDSMELDDDGWNQAESEHEMSRVTQLYLATNDVSSVHSVFTAGVDGGKPDFVLRKLHVLSIFKAQATEDKDLLQGNRHKVRIMANGEASTSAPAALVVYINDRAAKQTTKINFKILFSPSNGQPREHQNAPIPTMGELLPVPIYNDYQVMHETRDIADLRAASNQSIAVLTEHDGLLLSPKSGLPLSIHLPRRMRMYDPADARIHTTQAARDVGLNRQIELTDGISSLSELWLPRNLLLKGNSELDLRVQVETSSSSSFVRQVLDVIKAVLPTDASMMITQLWHRSLSVVQQERESKWIRRHDLEALCMTILAFAVGSLRSSQDKRRRESRESNQASNDLVQLDARGRSLPVQGLQWRRLMLDENLTKSRSGKQSSTRRSPTAKHINFSFNDIEANTRRMLHTFTADNVKWLLGPQQEGHRAVCSLRILIAVQALREDMWISSSMSGDFSSSSSVLAACVAQLGHYLGLPKWSWRRASVLLADFDCVDWDFSRSVVPRNPLVEQYQHIAPFQLSHWIEDNLFANTKYPFTTLEDICCLGTEEDNRSNSRLTASLLPNLHRILRYVQEERSALDLAEHVRAITESGLIKAGLADLRAGIAAPAGETIARAQRRFRRTGTSASLHVIDGKDLAAVPIYSGRGALQQSTITTLSDIHSVTSCIERSTHPVKSQAINRNLVASQLFADDRRLVEVSNIMNPAALQIAECPARPEWTDMEHLEEQKKVMAHVMTRTIALPAGNGMFAFDSQRPLLSEKFHVPGFSMQCQMKPMDNTISADRTGFTEEKLNWAFLHAGTAAGLHISRKAAGIDTSWILFNKPQELTNRHAGFLLALGLNGHLRNMAKWLAFKYLTPKHTMTSIGLLLGLSASHMGTMDTLITRMLSVHISCMLPPGAAELNVSPLTQTAGLVGIGLLHYKTQHRRMSEIMLSELEHRNLDEAGSAADVLHDESYRLAAGIALGLINLGRGGNLQGLQGMALLERLLSLAVGSRPVELVHVVDKATAGSIIAIALTYMKTMDSSIANKINVPGTLSQLDHIRPDILLLRTVAKNLIMWEDIRDESDWIRSQLPLYASYVFSDKSSTTWPLLQLRSADIPIFNIIAGHAWSLSLRYAGSASTRARDEILRYLEAFWVCSKQEAQFYDAQLTRTTLRRCIDLLALAAATVMAGTGDLVTFRYLRRLHGRTDADTTYGSHMATHLAIGALFLGGGTYTFSTSNLAIAALIMSFYPLFPGDVLDNAVHLQALRHLWVLAAEPRCAVCVDTDSGRSISLPLRLTLKNGEHRDLKAPCLLPDLATVSVIETMDSMYWKTRLDFSNECSCLSKFRRDQTIFVRKAPATEASPLVFSQALAASNEKQSMPPWFNMWAWLLERPVLKGCVDTDELDLILSTNERSALHLDERETVLDSRLTLWSDARSINVQKLKNVRLLVQWASRKRLEGDHKLHWLGNAFIERLESVIAARMLRIVAT